MITNINIIFNRSIASLKENEAEKVRMFTQLHHLQPYLDDIDIDTF